MDSACLRMVTSLGLLTLAALPGTAAPLEVGVARIDLTPPLAMKAALGG